MSTNFTPPTPARKPRDFFGCLLPLSMVALAVVWALIGCLTILAVPWAKGQLPGVTLAETGTFGDTFGAANALFASLGVAGVVYTLLLQHRAHRREDERGERARIDDRDARDRQARLLMLGALVTARSALVHTYRSLHRQSQVRLQGIPRQDEDETYRSTFRMTLYYEDLHYLHLRELIGIVKYAEEQAGWDAIRREYVPTDIEDPYDMQVRLDGAFEDEDEGGSPDRGEAQE
jgi:hypothetical protein